jgi:hypothetical protein
MHGRGTAVVSLSGSRERGVQGAGSMFLTIGEPRCRTEMAAKERVGWRSTDPWMNVILLVSVCVKWVACLTIRE